MIPAEKSAAFVCAMERVLDVYERPYDEERPVVTMDESPKQIVEYKTVTGSDGAQYQDSEYIRRGVAELFVAFEPLAGYREMTVEADHKAATWVGFIAGLLDGRYREAKKVTLVLDNFSTHKPHQFYNYFPAAQAKQYLDRLEFVYTPAHGSWLNMAEIQFSIITRQCFDQSFESIDQVKQVVKQWVETQNNARRGANWQFTTADARVKLAKLYPTI